MSGNRDTDDGLSLAPDTLGQRGLCPIVYKASNKGKGAIRHPTWQGHEGVTDSAHSNNPQQANWTALQKDQAKWLAPKQPNLDMYKTPAMASPTMAGDEQARLSTHSIDGAMAMIYQLFEQQAHMGDGATTKG